MTAVIPAVIILAAGLHIGVPPMLLLPFCAVLFFLGLLQDHDDKTKFGSDQ